jgi:hypothetical protein
MKWRRFQTSGFVIGMSLFNPFRLAWQDQGSDGRLPRHQALLR